MGVSEEAAMEMLRRAGGECVQAIAKVGGMLDDISNVEIARYKAFLSDVLVSLVNLHGVAMEMLNGGRIIGDSELGEISSVFVQHLNVRRAAMLVLVPLDRFNQDAEITKSEQSIRRVVETLRNNFGICYPDLWL